MVGEQVKRNHLCCPLLETHMNEIKHIRRKARVLDTPLAPFFFFFFLFLYRGILNHL
jgi:hypothetical protein